MSVLHKAGSISYGLIGSESVVDSLVIEVGLANLSGFNYFHQKFGMPYDFLLKKSISSGHALFVAVDEQSRLLGFARFEKIADDVERMHRGKKSVVKRSVHLLRSIEVHPSFRHIGVGRLLFAISVEYLKSNVITMPDNSEAARFFKDKLMFEKINDNDCTVSARYKSYLLLAYPKARVLLKTVAGNYPRMVMPELIDSYESLMFRSKMGKSISRKDIVRFEDLLMNSSHLLDRKLLREMNVFLNNFVTNS
ncbi:GNAT family N-acetyltransferase [Methanolobus sp. ZRKC2]|uniref:GNAT family N-acetyltransferase n=1 Tax=Methanolobus sp. ZRKC2 TaxID=3125783 RepID=UPI00324659A3